MNKSILLVILALVLIMGLIVPSCAKPAPAPAPGAAPTAAPPGTEYQYQWRNSSNYPTDSEGAEAMFRFGDLVTERTMISTNAMITGVSLEEVDLFEHNFPVRVDVKLKILRELWTRQVSKR